MKETSIMAEIDLERRVLKLKLFYILWDEGGGKDDIEQGLRGGGGRF
jgi:hypothetical protein